MKYYAGLKKKYLTLRSSIKYGKNDDSVYCLYDEVGESCRRPEMCCISCKYEPKCEAKCGKYRRINLCRFAVSKKQYIIKMI